MSEQDSYAFRSLAWVMARSTSAFNSVVWARIRAGDAPADPAKAFTRGRAIFGLVEWPDGRWLVLPLGLPRRAG